MDVSTVAILPGSFHPPTIAHLGLAQLALRHAARVLFTMPRTFPHKRYEGVALDERIAMLRKLTAGESRFDVAVTEGGLFIDMAREVRARHPAAQRIYLVCGRDAAERITGWTYEDADSIERQLEEYELLVASRQGDYTPPPHLAHRIHSMSGTWDDVSATRVREAIQGNGDWRILVPPAIHDDVARLYSPARFDSRNARNR